MYYKTVRNDEAMLDPVVVGVRLDWRLLLCPMEGLAPMGMTRKIESKNTRRRYARPPPRNSAVSRLSGIGH